MARARPSREALRQAQREAIENASRLAMAAVEASVEMQPKPRPARPGPKPRGGVTSTRSVHVRLTEADYQAVLKACLPGQKAPDVLREGGLMLALHRSTPAPPAKPLTKDERAGMLQAINWRDQRPPK